VLDYDVLSSLRKEKYEPLTYGKRQKIKKENSFIKKA
tara:strand:+ start:41 stop:151 length:111 start_codon:yes stop_codon:yes gene_type:complete